MQEIKAGRRVELGEMPPLALFIDHVFENGKGGISFRQAFTGDHEELRDTPRPFLERASDNNLAFRDLTDSQIPLTRKSLRQGSRGVIIR